MGLISAALSPGEGHKRAVPGRAEDWSRANDCDDFNSQYQYSACMRSRECLFSGSSDNFLVLRVSQAFYSNCEGEDLLAGNEKEGAKTRFGRSAVVAAGSVSETSSSARIYATLSMRRRSESSHLWRATSCARQEKIEDFHFHDVRHAFATILLRDMRIIIWRVYEMR